jgi:hypothetical protein
VISDYAKPIYIPAGMDSLQNIGALQQQKGGSSQAFGIRAWKDQWSEAFPSKETAEEDDGSFNPNKFPDDMVDKQRFEKEYVLQIVEDCIGDSIATL